VPATVRDAQERIDRWMSEAIDPALHLPPANPFIATDFSLRHEQQPPPAEEDLTAVDVDEPAERGRIAGVLRCRCRCVYATCACCPCVRAWSVTVARQ
jgi:hypothetical protein